MKRGDLVVGETYWCAGPTDQSVVFMGMDIGRKTTHSGPVVVRAIGVPYKKGLNGVLVEATVDEYPRCTCSQCGLTHIPDWAFEPDAEKWHRQVEFTVHLSSLSDLVEAQADIAAHQFEMKEMRQHFRKKYPDAPWNDRDAEQP